MGGMERMRLAASLALLLAPCAFAQNIRVEPLAQIVVEPETAKGERPFGGISGLCFDPARTEEGRAFAVTDDKQDPRFYELAIAYDAEEQTLRVETTGPPTLLPTDDVTDCEAIHFDGRRFVLGFEARPVVATYEPLSRDFETFTLPRETTENIRPNRGFESVAPIDLDGRRVLLAITETAPEPFPEAAPKYGSRCLALALDPATGESIAEGAYTTEPAPTPRIPLTPTFNSLTEIAPLGDGRLLALERSLEPTRGFDAALFVVEAELLEGRLKLWKTPIGSLRDLGVIGPDNLEAMAIGPEINDEKGGRLLVLMADNDFGRRGVTVTQVVALRLLVD